MKELPYLPFVIDDKPYCLWEIDIHKTNIETINRIDPKYFSVIAETFEPMLESENKQYAATALRTYYSHALETLFALICATIQSPDCIVGWLLKYENRDLFSLVKKIQNYEPILTKLKIDNPKGWENISKAIFSPIETEIESKTKIEKSFSRLWRHFAEDFLKDGFSEEYNSIKHGFRLRIGGFSLAMGMQDAPGIPAPPERMRLIGKSDFGSSFFTTEKIQKQSNFIINRKRLNWHPENFVNALSLISTSIENITSYLKAINGEDISKLQYVIPEEEGFHKKPWTKTSSFNSFGVNSTIIVEKVTPLSNEEILSFYNPK